MADLEQGEEHYPVKVCNTDLEVCDTCKGPNNVPMIWDIAHPLIVPADEDPR